MAQRTYQHERGANGRISSVGGVSEEERIRLIGELLCKGIFSSPSLQRPAGCIDAVLGAASCAPEDRVVDYLRRHQSGSPAEIRAVVNLSRSGVYRALQRLLLTGQIVSNGERTSAVAYRLVDPSRN